MKLLFLISLLAFSEARGVRDDNLLQRLSERRPDEGESQNQNPINAIKVDLEQKIGALNNRLGSLEDVVAGLLAKEIAEQGGHEGEEAEGGEGGQSGSGEPVNPEEPVNPPGHEEEPPHMEESGTNQEGEEGKEPSGSGSGESSNPEQTAMRMLVQKIRSRLDEKKREQTRMKLSEALRRMMPESRRK